MELCYEGGAVMLEQAHIAKNYEEGKAMLEKVIKDGSAFDLFVKMVKAQGGDVEYILHPEKFELAKKIIPILAKEDGYIKELDALEIGIAAMKLGAGRETLEDKIDMSAGIILNHKVGSKVNKGDVLCVAYTNKNNVDDALAQIRGAYKIVDEVVYAQPVIREIVD